METTSTLDESGSMNSVNGDGRYAANGAQHLQDASATVHDDATLIDGSDEFRDDDPICVVGMACRLPGDIRSPSDLWEFLVQRRTAQGPVPRERFNLSAFYHPDGSRAGVMDADGGYFLNEDVRLFDNGFFGINAMEARYMDPQQRKLLEVVFECFEGMGLGMDSVSGSDIGVYVGNFTVDHQTMQARDPDYMHRYNATGSGTAILSNRISHVFDLHGPSMTIDTACSSSIYCIHHAASAIRNGECEGAIVAGANLITSPEQHIGTMKGGVLSPTSTCHTFDASADGYGRAEAVNAIYLKRLSSAIRDGDKVWAVVRGTAINASGKTPGITQPSAAIQQKVIRKAYTAAGLDFDGTDFVECHGTGTAVGDPIEVEALRACFGSRGHLPLKIGSVKSSLGHSEAASGLTSLIKVAMAFENGRIPPTYGVKNPNPKLHLSRANMSVPLTTEDWPRHLRRASINSFGYGGANAHLIVESFASYRGKLPPYHTSESRPEPLRQLLTLPISAGSKESLLIRLEQMKDVVQGGDSHRVNSLALSLTRRRPNLRFRGALLAKLGTASEETRIVEIDETQRLDAISTSLPVAFVFTGQGAQYPEVGKTLFENNNSFRETIRQLDSVLRGLPDAIKPAWTIEQALLDPPERSEISLVTRSQPVCTAIQIALVQLLRAWGISPSAVIGHSSGEIAAAYAAGFLDSTEAVLAAYFRGFAVGQLSAQRDGGDGAMVAAGVGPDAGKQLLLELGLQEKLCVACTNSPSSVTFSGSRKAAEILLGVLNARRIFARLLKTDGQAYHSHLVKGAGQMYEDLLAPHLNPSFKSESKEIKMFSSVAHIVAGQSVLLRAVDARKARYWRENLEQCVQFSEALRSLIEDGKGYHLIEIGPHPALKAPIHQICAAAEVDARLYPYSATLSRDQDSELAMKRLAGSLYQYGYNLAWGQVNDLGNEDIPVLHNLYPYPWNYSAGLHWHEPRQSVELRNRKYRRHELLGSAQLASNGIDWSWRNLLQLREASWLSEHRIETQVVFPAAGYLAIAMEALAQIWGIAGQRLEVGGCYHLRNVSISSALVVQADDEVANSRAAKDTTEIHTIMCAKKISSRSTSRDWFEFSISSWSEGRATLHCTGDIRLDHTMSGTRVQDATHFDEWPSMRPWYEKLADRGLCFGPAFQTLHSLRTDPNHLRTDAISTTKIMTQVGTATDTVYPVHPVSMDACLQAASMGSTSGKLETLGAFIPVSIAECRVWPPSIERGENEGTIHTRSSSTGFGTKRVDCTLLDADESPIVDMGSVLLSLYTGQIERHKDASRDTRHLQRHPALRITWKPDILRLRPASPQQLDNYLANWTAQAKASQKNSAVASEFGAVLDLVGHSKPNFRALEILPSSQSTSRDSWLRLFNKETAFPRIGSWTIARLSESGGIKVDSDTCGPFDALVLDQTFDSNQFWIQSGDHIRSLLSDTGVLVAHRSDSALQALSAGPYIVAEVGTDVIVGVRQSKVVPSIRGKDVVLVCQTPSQAVEAFGAALSTHLYDIGAADVSVIPLDRIETTAISPSTLCLSLLELEHEFLATMSDVNMDRLKSLTNRVSNLLWLTGANMLGAPNPDLTLSSGLLRALGLEQPSLRLSVLDLGPLDGLETQPTFGNIERALTVYDEIDDKEFIQVDGNIYTSRFVPDADVNDLFRRRLGHQDPIRAERLGSCRPARLAVGRPGVTETIHFRERERKDPVSDLPPPGFVDVEITAVSLNAKDVYSVSGHVETKSGTAALEFCGVITAVGGVSRDGDGDDGHSIGVGDRVVVMAPNYFTTIERVPIWSVHKLLPGEDEEVLCTIPIAYATALYALHDRGHLRAGESVLIHAGAGALGTAAINIAKMAGATVYTTCSSEAKRRYLVSQLGVPVQNIFNSRDTSFAEGIKAATGGHGVDLVINSLVGDCMHASWDCIANFGRFIEVGKRELVDAGKLQMSTFLKNTTFTAFDLSELFYHEDPYYRDIWIAKTKEALDLYRSGKIKPGPITIHDVSNISSAYRAFSAKDRIGKLVVSLRNPNSLIPVAPARYRTTFDPQKIYLLVGCLGGLGRSLSRWMLNQGARHFAFLGRSGADRPSAQALVAHLERSGAEVLVARGDVAVPGDVEAFVQACVATRRPIGGVVQAAVGLREALFSQMSGEAWRAAVQPKWRGTWNLHHALKPHENDALDFFLLTSSVAGSVATATESNYCAANAFLDAWARWRRTQGRKATSVGLGMISDVGYLHENPDIEALLLRKGLQPLGEMEFLQVVDLALSGAGGSDGSGDDNDNRSLRTAHMLTGLESQAFRKLAERGWDVTGVNMLDPRSSVLAAPLLAVAEQEAGGMSSGVAQQLQNTPSWLTGLSPAVIQALDSESGASTLVDAILRGVRKRFSSLILMPLDQIDDNQALSQFGVDSMITAEFRTWIWTAFKVDIPFHDIMSQQKTLASLADAISTKLQVAA